MKNNHKKILYFVSFLEGAGVMATELCGGKLLAPYFGTSLNVWASVLGITLFGLMCGYFVGGWASRYFGKNITVLSLVLGAGGVLLAIMPYLAHLIMQNTIHLSINSGTVISLFVFLFPPLFLFGVSSPLIINFLTDDSLKAGKMAGNVYAISTLGGIFSTFLLGFYLMGALGIKTCTSLFGVIILVFSAFLFFIVGKNNKSGLTFLLLLAIACFFSFNKNDDYLNGFEVLYKNDGVMGELKVVKFGERDPTEYKIGVLVDNVFQSVYKPSDEGFHFWDYTEQLTEVVSYLKPQKGNLLLLGFGAGTLYKSFSNKNFNVKAVEFDKRLVEVSEQFFNKKNTNVVIDDARHYINKETNEYDVLVFDCFKGEVAADYILTKEGIQQSKKILKDDGLIFINFYGYLNGDLGLPLKSIVKTLKNEQLFVEILPTGKNVDNRNLIIIAGESDWKLDLYREGETPEDFFKRLPFTPYFIDMESLKENEGFILTDNNTHTNIFSKTSLKWREAYKSYFFD